MVLSFQATVSALTYSIVRERCGESGEREDFPHNRVTRFVLAQQARMPDYLTLPIMCLTLAFDAWAVATSGRAFHRLPHERRWRIIRAWSESRLGFRRDFIKFFESLVVFGWYAQTHES